MNRKEKRRRLLWEAVRSGDKIKATEGGIGGEFESLRHLGRNIGGSDGRDAVRVVVACEEMDGFLTSLLLLEKEKDEDGRSIATNVWALAGAKLRACVHRLLVARLLRGTDRQTVWDAQEGKDSLAQKWPGENLLPRGGWKEA